MGEQITYGKPESETENSSGNELEYFAKSEFDKVLALDCSQEEKTKLFAYLARFNTLYMISKAGSGHLGSCFSSLDIVSWLYLNVLQEHEKYFSSKGHDAPALYAVQAALGIIDFDLIHDLRRLNGLPGHPDVKTAGSVTNTGSLGMGVSKAKGFQFANRVLGHQEDRIFVMTGDGELQEGHFWESLVSAVNFGFNNLTVLVDHNKVQSDMHVKDVSDLGDIEAKFAAFGWKVTRIDGHDYGQISSVLGASYKSDAPHVIIADTVKGRGVSFMEHTRMGADEIFYRFHSGAPAKDDYRAACRELMDTIRILANEVGLELPGTSPNLFEEIRVAEVSERMIPAYSDIILKLAGEREELVALDADLMLDTGLIPFQQAYPNRFIECGIAEQDMVSTAGTMALGGLIPVVHSFACFLTSRASEQIYNNCTQENKVVYVGSLAGLLPGGPGHSHQAVRDITAMLAMPGMTILEPVNASQVASALQWAVNDNAQSTYLRLTSIPYEQTESLRGLTDWEPGKGHVVEEGNQIALICFGPTLAFEASKAAKMLKQLGISVKVIVTPWINQIDTEWLGAELREISSVATLESHYSESGAGSFYLAQMARGGLLQNRKVDIWGVDEIPVCGRNEEVLAYHGLDAESLVKKVSQLCA